MRHTEVTVIVGSDRVREFKTLLNKYNGKDFTFDKINVMSAGQRDPDAEGAAGMSATKMRTAAQTGDYKSFKKGAPTALSDRDVKVMYDKIRSEMGTIKEEIEWSDEDFEFTDAELDAAVEMMGFDKLDEDQEIDEEFTDYLDEVRQPLTIAQRMKIGRRMKRLATRMARMRKIRSKRMADPKRLERRARKAAIKILRKRFAGKQGQNYAKLSPGSKMSVDRIIQKKASVIPTFAKRLLPKMRKAEMERLKRARGGGAPTPTTAAQTLKQGDHIEPHVPILYEEEVDTKLMALLRVTFPDSSERNLVVRALRGGSKSLQNPTLRPYLMNILLRLLDGVQDDPSIYNKVKEKMRRLGLEEDTTSKKPQDPDVADRKGSQPVGYYKGVKSKSTKAKRDAHFKKYAEKPGMGKDKESNYKPAPGDSSAETKPSIHTKKYKAMYGENINTAFEELFLEEEVLTEKQIEGLKKKSEKSSIPYGILKQVYNRGMAAWKSGHRPGTTPQQWAFARVNSFITKGSGTWGGADKDLAAKARGSKKEEVGEDAVKAAKDKIKREKEADKTKHDAMLDRARLQKAQNKNRATESLDDQFESLWANIHKKRKEGRPMRKKGEKGAPTDDAFSRAKNEEYGAGEEGTDGLVKKYKEDTPGEDCTCFDHVISEAEYQGRKVKLNDPMRSNDGKKKFYVYTKNEKGNIVKVGFGDPNMEIKRDDPGRRKNFRARHNCDNPGPKWKARYWSCYQWRAGSKVDN